MDNGQLLNFLSILEKLKCRTRHSWTSNGRQESVAEHSFRLAVMAMLVANDFPALDIDRIIKMCLIHDWGEAITGDIPVFEKTDSHQHAEDAAIASLLDMLDGKLRQNAASLFDEISENTTAEAKLFHALDRLEALIQHNEAGVDTWIHLERDLQLTYGDADCAAFPFTQSLRETVRQHSLRLLSQETAK